jgi:hypothetical protein
LREADAPVKVVADQVIAVRCFNVDVLASDFNAA